MIHAEPRGWAEVICGSMFSGKTEELIRRLRRAQIARQQVQVFKPGLDDRYGVESVTSHNGVNFGAASVEVARDILDLVEPDTQVVAIDEAQFFGSEITQVSKRYLTTRPLCQSRAGARCQDPRL